MATTRQRNRAAAAAGTRAISPGAVEARTEPRAMASARSEDAGWIDVCRADRIPADRGVCALVAGRQVALFRVGGELFAMSNYDPFSRAFVMSRGIVGTKGDVLKVASPIYKQTFDLRTGQCIDNPGVRVPVYPCRVANGLVQVRVPDLTFSSNGALPRPSGPLSGWVIAIGETRERDRLREMLTAKGALVLSYPVVAIADSSDGAAVDAWLGTLLAGELDLCVFYTGEGIQRLVAAARRQGIEAAVLRALKNIETIARGPKAARALREVGLLPTLALETPTTEGIIDLLRSRDLHAMRVGVQLYPRASSKRLVQFLRGAGADPRPVAPYVYTDASADAAYKDLVMRMVSGHVDAMVFTSRAQVDRLCEVAARLGLTPALMAGLRRTRIATVGPVVAAAVRAHGLKVSIVPAELFFLKSLVNEIAAAAQKSASSAA